MALILTRSIGQRIMVGEHIVIRLVATLRTDAAQVQIGNSIHWMRVGYSIELEPGVNVFVNRIKRGSATIGVEAPAHIRVHREEVYKKIKAEELAAKQARMPERVGMAICGVFVALSAWPMSALLQLAGA